VSVGSINSVMTVLELLRSSTDYFRKRKIDSPRLNAEHLLAHVLGRTRMELYLDFERTVGETELVPLRTLVRRRGQGEPLQHLLGTVEFCGHVFAIDKRAMVPRPETEELVELLKPEIRNQKSKILDVGTGSGVIALTLSAAFPEAEVHGLDVSEEALTLACENAERLGLGERVHFSRRNLLENVDERFDIIVANLPYISTQDRNSLSREVLCDPEIALFGGESGNELIRELICQAPAHFRIGGLLALEIGLGQCGSLASLLTQKKYSDIRSKTDYSGETRFMFARYG
jgi:release factor glutamine methyltransferase